jgi:hypothetical protein
MGGRCPTCGQVLAEHRVGSRSARGRAAIIAELEAAPRQQMLSDALDSVVADRCDVSVKTVRNLRSQLVSAGFVRVWPVRSADGRFVGWSVARALAPDQPEADQPEQAPSDPGAGGAGTRPPAVVREGWQSDDPPPGREVDDDGPPESAPPPEQAAPITYRSEEESAAKVEDLIARMERGDLSLDDALAELQEGGA